MPELISHAIVIGLSIALVVSMAAMLNVIRDDARQGMAQAMAENICYQLKLAAEELTPGSQSATVQLDLPNRIGGETYAISASGHDITVASASASRSCVVGAEAELSGAASGRIKLTLSEDTIALSRA